MKTLPRRTWDRALLRLLGSAVVAIVLAIDFARLGDEVSEGATHAFDMAVLEYAQVLRAGSPRYTEVLRDLSALGGTVVMTLLTASTCGYLWLVRSRVGIFKRSDPRIDAVRSRGESRRIAATC